ncbi:hypothetical protein K377_03878 [Streptomyces sp. PsTaAH-137]|nr:hypothetical protein [Streptomyces sp. SID8367]RAJ82827.1 hypothetical protein K377_03878 [Streptomyces sp. PsTaAH-137]
MTTPNELRLLPWSGPEGQPCYLSTDNANSYLSRLADNTEAIHLGMAAEVLDQAVELLSGEKVAPNDLRLVTRDLVGALTTTLRVATSRGRRLPQPDSARHERGDEAPRLTSAIG